jgi:hypothetical protein
MYVRMYVNKLREFICLSTCISINWVISIGKLHLYLTSKNDATATCLSDFVTIHNMFQTVTSFAIAIE